MGKGDLIAETSLDEGGFFFSERNNFEKEKILCVSFNSKQYSSTVVVFNVLFALVKDLFCFYWKHNSAVSNIF
jgi:hypothetical protein